MEFVNILGIEEFQPASIVKKIPIMTDRLMAALICIDKEKENFSHNNADFDEFHYVVKGSGMIKIGDNDLKLNEGMLVFVPHTESYCLSTDNEQLVILTISPLPENEVGSEDGGIT